MRPQGLTAFSQGGAIAQQASRRRRTLSGRRSPRRTASLQYIVEKLHADGGAVLPVGVHLGVDPHREGLAYRSLQAATEEARLIKTE